MNKSMSFDTNWVLLKSLVTVNLFTVYIIILKIQYILTSDAYYCETLKLYNLDKNLEDAVTNCPEVKLQK